MASQTLTFQPVADSYVTFKYPTNNFSNSQTLRVGCLNMGNFASYLGFDLSSIPKNKSITSAILTFYVTGFVYTASGEPMTATPSSLTPFPFVIKARRVTDIPISDIDTINYNYVKALTTSGNVYDVNVEGDTSINVAYAVQGGTVNLSIGNLEHAAGNDFVIALFQDPNFWNSLSKDYNENISSKEGYIVPQLTVVVDDYIPPKPTNLSPNSTTKNPAGEIKLSWQFEDSYLGTSQATYELLYSTNNFATSTTLTGTTASFRVIAANAFLLGQTVKWKVRVTDSNGDTSAWSDEASFLVGATVPSAPIPSSPINTIVNSSDEIYFRWKYVDLYGYSQAKYDLQYRKGTDVETTVTVTSAVNQYNMPEATITDGGDYSWRVRCYNEFNEVGSYSAWQPFYAIGKPAAPVITSVSNNARPLIKWTQSGQDLFVLKIYKDNLVVYDSGEQLDAPEFMVTDYLEDGSYRVGIKISNAYGFWSNETLYQFAISTTKPSTPTIAGNAINNAISLVIGSSTTQNLIYRKGEKETGFKLIGDITNSTLIDYTAPAGDNQYFVRATTDTSFKDSQVITIHFSFYGIMLSGKDNPSEILNLYKTKDTDKRKNITPSKTQFLMQFNGRTYPVLQSMPFRNHSESHEYFISEGEFDKFYNIVNSNTVLYRNNYGYGFEAAVSNISIAEDIFGYLVSFSLTRTED